MVSVAQFLALGGPDLIVVSQQEWIFDLPKNLDASRAGALLVRIHLINSPRIRIFVNENLIMERSFAAGDLVSVHYRIREGLLEAGQNRLLCVGDVPDENGRPSGSANFGEPVIHYHVSISERPKLST